MDKDQIMKYLMIAGAAYLVYWYLTQTPTTPTVPKSLVLPAADTGRVVAPGASYPSLTTMHAAITSGTNAGFAKPSDEVLMLAAMFPDMTVSAGSYKMNVHQWNWYRTKYQTDKAGNPNPDPNTYSPSLDDITDPNKGITANEYHALLSQKGLSGLGWTPIVPQYLSQWTM